MLSSTPAPVPSDIPAVVAPLSCDCCEECAAQSIPPDRSTTLSDLATLFSVLSIVFYVTRGK